jgi:hypothetical protein
MDLAGVFPFARAEAGLKERELDQKQRGKVAFHVPSK